MSGKIRFLLGLVGICAASACTNLDGLCPHCYPPKNRYVYLRDKTYANDEPVIPLQNLMSRTIVYCHSTETNSAETCAEVFESNGYVRVRDIPYKTADYDFLKNDTYPTRRWRNDELTPRW